MQHKSSMTPLFTQLIIIGLLIAAHLSANSAQDAIVRTASAQTSASHHQHHHHAQTDEDNHYRDHDHDHIPAEEDREGHPHHRHHRGHACLHDEPKYRRAIYGHHRINNHAISAVLSSSLPQDGAAFSVQSTSSDLNARNYDVVVLGKRSPKTVLLSSSNTSGASAEGPEELLTMAVLRTDEDDEDAAVEAADGNRSENDDKKSNRRDFKSSSSSLRRAAASKQPFVSFEHHRREFKQRQTAKEANILAKRKENRIDKNSNAQNDQFADGSRSVPPSIKQKALFRSQNSRVSGADEDEYYDGFDGYIPPEPSLLSTPLRVTFRTPNLFDEVSYCREVGQQVPDFADGLTNCSTADDIFTDYHRDLLTNTVLPAAAEVLSRYLLVVPSFRTLQVPAAICGSQITIPRTDQTSGVSATDFVVYVGASPIEGQAIAWAGMCALDRQGRPIIARANFSPKALVDPDSSLNEVIRMAVHELMHALGFAPAWVQSDAFAYRDAIETFRQQRRGGQPVILYKGPAAVSAARKHFNCTLIDGVELEDEGGDGTASAHWERRTHRDDLMAGVAGVTMAYSEMSFGLLEDSGHYFVRRSSDPIGNPWPSPFDTAALSTALQSSSILSGRKFSAVDSALESPSLLASSVNYDNRRFFYAPNDGIIPNLPTNFQHAKYMYKAGCGVTFSMCNTTEGGRGKYFCFEKRESEHFCTLDFNSIGYCNVVKYSSRLPAWARYFAEDATLGGDEQLYNYCPYVAPFGNRHCNSARNTFANNTKQGLYFAADGRCFETSKDFIMEGFEYPKGSSPGAARCLKARCPNGTRIEFSVGTVALPATTTANNAAKGGSSAADADDASKLTWRKCPMDGSSAIVNAPAGHTGTVVCPEAKAFCTRELFVLDMGDSPTVSPTRPTTQTDTPIVTTPTGEALSSTTTNVLTSTSDTIITTSSSSSSSTSDDSPSSFPPSPSPITTEVTATTATATANPIIVSTTTPLVSTTVTPLLPTTPATSPVPAVETTTTAVDPSSGAENDGSGNHEGRSGADTTTIIIAAVSVSAAVLLLIVVFVAVQRLRGGRPYRESGDGEEEGAEHDGGGGDDYDDRGGGGSGASSASNRLRCDHEERLLSHTSADTEEDAAQTRYHNSTRSDDGMKRANGDAAMMTAAIEMSEVVVIPTAVEGGGAFRFGCGRVAPPTPAHSGGGSNNNYPSPSPPTAQHEQHSTSSPASPAPAADIMPLMAAEVLAVVEVSPALTDD